jgi:hypothetical protein
MSTMHVANLPPPIVTVEVSPERIPENKNYKILFKFTRTGDIRNPLKVYYTLGGTASSDDYKAHTIPDVIQEIEIPSGESSTVLEITPIEDVHPEGDETIIVGLVPDDSYNRGTFDGVTGIINEDVTTVVPFNYSSLIPIGSFSAPFLSFVWDSNFYDGSKSIKNYNLSKIVTTIPDSDVEEVPGPLSIFSFLGLIRFRKTIRQKYKL